jgi:uncharacterized protein YcbK (DUF882 family)
MKDYFTMDELTRSATAIRKGIDNTPTAEARAALTALKSNVLNPLREAWGQPIVVTSGYRCPRLNSAVGGARGSQHLYGQAADIRTLEDTPEQNRRLFELAQRLRLPFDQLIDEHGYNWIHVSHGPRNRRQVLHIR